MCGIAGVLVARTSHADPAALSIVDAMTDLLRHRGPSGGNTWVDPDAGIALGHRRLSILDLSAAGSQPMVSPSGRFVATFNGEIYNFRELRRELEHRGYTFRGGSDTEVLLAAWEAWGCVRALGRFAGMFALAVWDRAERKLHLARDRLGKKPLYVARILEGLAFASELKAFQAVPSFEPELSRTGLAAYLARGWIGESDCIWTDVIKLPPGSCLTIGPTDLPGRGVNGLRDRMRRWWDLEEVIAAGRADPCALPASQLVGDLDHLLRLSVSQRMISDVPLGAFLSGGVDSSLVVALMQQLSGRPVKTYTIGFAEESYDEAARSARVAAHLGTDHTTFRVTPRDAVSAIPDLPDVWDEPLADDAQIPTLLLARLARQDVTVALSGDGGDEVFGGYHRHAMYGRLSPLLRVPAGLRRTAAGCLTTLSPMSWDAWLQATQMPETWSRALRRDRLHRFADLLGAEDAQAWYDRATTLRLGQRRPPVPAASNNLQNPLTQLLYRDTTEYLPSNVLVKVDRATMAAGLECRSPLLDHRVLAYAWRIPLELKLRDGQGKWILRQVLQRYVPEALTRGKSGFDAPVGAWMRGPLRDWADPLITDLARRGHAPLDPDAILSTWDEHRSGRRDRSREVWALAMLGAWMRHWSPRDAMRSVRSWAHRSTVGWATVGAEVAELCLIRC